MHAMRSAAAATVLAATVLTAFGTATAHAHGGTLAVDITGHERGHVTALVTWENDKDSVDERVAATVNAVSPDGTRTAGPWVLVPDPSDAKRFTTAEVLPPGRWKVSVEVGHPALGRDEADITVAAAPARPAPERPAPVAPPPAEPTADAGPGPFRTAPVATGILLAGCAAAFLAVRHRRRSRG